MGSNPNSNPNPNCKRVSTFSNPNPNPNRVSTLSNPNPNPNPNRVSTLSNPNPAPNLRVKVRVSVWVYISVISQPILVNEGALESVFNALSNAPLIAKIR